MQTRQSVASWSAMTGLMPDGRPYHSIFTVINLSIMILIRTFFLAFWLVGLGFAQSVSVLDSSLTLSVTDSPRSKAYFTNHTARGTWQAGINFNYDHAAQAWVKHDTLSRIYQEIDGEERLKQNMRLLWNEDQQGWIDTLYFSRFNEWGNGIKHVIFLHGNGNLSLTTYTADQLVDSTYSYQYDDQGNTWFHQSLSVRSYDAEGNLTKILQQDWDTSSMTYHNRFRTLHVYDSDGHLIQTTNEDWENGNWKGLSRSSQTYDANHNLTQQVWESGLWTGGWQYRTRITYQYDADNLLISELSEEYQPFGSTWHNSARYTYLPNPMNPASPLMRTLEEWRGDTAWHPVRREIRTYNSDSLKTSEIQENWDGSQQVWASLMGNEWIYDDEGKLLAEITKFQDFNSNGLRNEHREVHSYDSLGKRVHTLGQVFDFDETWETIEETFYYYSLQAVSSIMASPSAELRLYPNPVQSVLYVDGLMRYEASIVDLSGREIKRFGLGLHRSGLDITEIAPGLYFLQVRDQAGFPRRMGFLKQ